jgi:hypothetical protein
MLPRVEHAEGTLLDMLTRDEGITGPEDGS